MKGKDLNKRESDLLDSTLKNMHIKFEEKCPLCGKTGGVVCHYGRVVDLKNHSNTNAFIHTCSKCNSQWLLHKEESTDSCKEQIEKRNLKKGKTIMEKITGDKLIGLVDIYAQKDTSLGKSTHQIDRREIASYIFSTILVESNRILETVNNIIDKINESEYYVKKLQQVNKDTIIDNIVVKLEKDDMSIKAGDIVCYCNPDTRELVDIRVLFRTDKDPKDKLVELNTGNLFKNKEDCIEAITKKVKENISKKYEKLIDDDYSYFLKNDSNIKQTSLVRNDSSEIKTDVNSPEVFRGEKGLEGTKGPSLSKEEWERISATIYGFVNTELNLKRP